MEVFLNSIFWPLVNLAEYLVKLSLIRQTRQDRMLDDTSIAPDSTSTENTSVFNLLKWRKLITNCLRILTCTLHRLSKLPGTRFGLVWSELPLPSSWFLSSLRPSNTQRKAKGTVKQKQCVLLHTTRSYWIYFAREHEKVVVNIYTKYWKQKESTKKIYDD